MKKNIEYQTWVKDARPVKSFAKLHIIFRMAKKSYFYTIGMNGLPEKEFLFE